MPQTIPDIEITSTWVSLNAITSIAVGTPMIISNKSITLMVIAEGTQPTSDDINGVPLTTYRDMESVKVSQSGSLELWIRTVSDSATGTISVQEKL